jgi:hypothetical protein
MEIANQLLVRVAFWLARMQSTNSRHKNAYTDYAASIPSTGFTDGNKGFQGSVSSNIFEFNNLTEDSVQSVKKIC